MYSGRVVSSRAVDAFASVLPVVAAVEVAGWEDPDVVLHVARQDLRLRWLPVGWPRQVREALRRRPRPDVIAAPQLSPGARELARQEGVGWLDETGAAEIHSGLLLVSRTGDSSARSRAKSRWRPATLAVCEVLISGTPATVARVVAATGLAYSTVTEALQVLAGDGLLTAEAARGPRSGRHVCDTDQLLDAYAAQAQLLRAPMSVRVGTLWRDPVDGVIEAGSAWHAAGLSWAVTSALTAAAWAPYLTEVTPQEVYVDGRTHGDLRRAAEVAGLREIAGGRLTLRPFPTPSGATLTEEPETGLVSVLWPRAYADLRVAGVRGEEAAEYLREQMSHD